MTGAVTVSAVVGMLSLVAGFALGWFARRPVDGCPTCDEPDQAYPSGPMLKLPRKTLSGS